MSAYAVLTAVGDDRPGLVDAISRFILDRGCNIEDSRMAVLGGEFAMIILVSGEEEAVARVIDGASAAGEGVGLAVSGRATRRPEREASAAGAPYAVRAYAMDHPGIVQHITHALADRKVNIRSLDTGVGHAPHTGQPLFSMTATVDVPRDVNIAELRRALEAIGEDENVDVSIGPVS